MAEYPLLKQSVPSTPITAYPPTIQGLLDEISNYLYFDDKINFKTYVKTLAAVTPTPPTPISQTYENIWFDLTSDGRPVSIQSYANPVWKEFQALKQGDMILTPANLAVTSPWGSPGQTYNVIVYSGSGSSTTAYTVPSAPPAPVGFQYKTFVGSY